MNSRIFFRSAVAAVAAVLLAAVLCAPPPARAQGSANVSGTVTYQRRPLRSVWVIVSQNGTEKGRALTGGDGLYYIGNLAGGGYQIRVERQGRQLYSKEIRLPDNSKCDIPLP